MAEQKSPPILKNVRILDFTWALAGPYATRLLADYGAEVIKVQPPLALEADDAIARGYYNTWNRNKLGITLNMDKPEGIILAKRLVGISGVVIENFSPHVMANWGLDYTNLKKIKPDIIMVAMSVVGHKGLKNHYSGYGPTVHALSGMTQLTSLPDRPPVGPGFSYADHAAGLYASMLLLGALEARRKTGKGQYIDISEVEVMKSLLNSPDDESAGAAPYGTYPCKGENRRCAIAVFTEEEWRGLKKTLGNPAWAENARFKTPADRLKNKDKLDKLVEDWTRQHTAAEVMRLLQKNGVAAGIVQDAADLVKDVRLIERGFFIEDADGSAADASPVRMSQSMAEYRRTAPGPGRDNDYVYGKLLGISEGQRAALKKQGVI
jgi:benzylsuccinate CoA-transferase BbsF subunit